MVEEVLRGSTDDTLAAYSTVYIKFSVFEPIIQAITGKTLVQILGQINEGFILHMHCSGPWLYYFNDVSLVSSYLFITWWSTETWRGLRMGEFKIRACESCTAV